jgi:abortive infection bacteriophage resistance protein
MLYTKPYLPIPDQIVLLKNRGLRFADDVYAVECLRRNGYYRLSAYWHPLFKIVVIAHHGRLWNLNLIDNPRLPAKGAISEFDPLLNISIARTRIYGICCILSYLSHVTNAQSPWIEDLKEIVKSFPNVPHASIKSMGFPREWESHGFWNYNATDPPEVTAKPTV